MSEKSNASPVGTGLLTLLTVLLVLVLAVFSILTLISARADLSLSRINADTVSAYYEADTSAVRQIQAFDISGKPELAFTVPMTKRQSLSVHVTRNEDSSLKILSWNVVSDGAEGIIIPD